MRVSFVVEGKTCSVNATYLRGMGRRFYKSEKATEFQERVAMAAKRAMRGKKPLDMRVGYRVKVYFHNVRCDLSGPAKLFEDACNGIVWNDDIQVKELAWTWGLDVERPRLEVEVYPLAA